MTRLQKKCLVGSACFHGLTVAVFLVTAAFRSEPVITEGRVLTLIPTRILDRPGIGGEPAAIAAKFQPPQPATPPAPPATSPPPHPADLAKPLARTTPKPPAPSTPSEKPAPQSAPSRRGIKVDLTPVSRSTKPAPKPSESAAQARAAAQEASRQRAQEISNIFAALDSNVLSKDPKQNVVALAGEGGGEAFVNYGTAVINVYYRAWKTPDDTTHKLAVADVKIVVLRYGTVVSSEFVNKSGDAGIDRSVQRALDAVKQLPPFPPNAPDAERSFIIRFNLEAKQDAG
jgi:TonB family protein